MSIFGVSGTLGFAAGPLFMTTAILWFGLKGSLSVLIPVGLVTILVMKFLPAAPAGTQATASDGSKTTDDQWGAFSFLAICVASRSVLFFGLLTFIPLYWVSILGQTNVAGGMALSVMTIAGVLGNLAGGRFADRFGNTRVMTSPRKIGQAKSRNFGQNDPSQEEAFCHEDDEVHGGADRVCAEAGANRDKGGRALTQPLACNTIVITLEQHGCGRNS